MNLIPNPTWDNAKLEFVHEFYGGGMTRTVARLSELPPRPFLGAADKPNRADFKDGVLEVIPPFLKSKN